MRTAPAQGGRAARADRSRWPGSRSTSPLAHLDRTFDYVVPGVDGRGRRCPGPGCGCGSPAGSSTGSSSSADRTPSTGARSPGWPGPSRPSRCSPPRSLGLARAVADHYGGVAGRRAPAGRTAAARGDRGQAVARAAARRRARAGAGAVVGLPGRGGLPPGASATAGPRRACGRRCRGRSWPVAVATAVRAALAAGRGALVVVADARDVARVSAALTEVCGAGHHVELTADLGPAERYRRFLAVSRGSVRCVVGTRAAQFAPVRDLGLAVVWDDGDDLHAEPHAPYPHVREVLPLRAGADRGGPARRRPRDDRGGAAARSTRAAGAPADAPTRPTLRAVAPMVRAAGDDAELGRDAAARTCPAAPAGLAHGARGAALRAGARAGAAPRLPARRWPARPAGRPPAARPAPVRWSSTSGHAIPHCRWCGRPAGRFTCRSCGGTRLRAQVVGAGRTAEELGRAFPGVPVRTSGRDEVLAAVPA